jgi:hypothetical protein
LGQALAAVLNPRRMFRHHPLGTTATIGVLVAAAVTETGSGRGRGHLLRMLSGTVRSLRGAILGTLITRLFWPARQTHGLANVAPASRR